MTKRTVSARRMCRVAWAAVLPMAVLLGAGTARADYNIKATEAGQSAPVPNDGKCNLVEAVASVNAGAPMYGCSGSGKKIILEGTGAHYKVPQAGLSIQTSDVEITSKVANKDFIEGDVDQRVIMVVSGAKLTLTGVTIQRTGTFKAQVVTNNGTLILSNSVVQQGDATLEGGGIYSTGALQVLAGSKVQNNKTGKNGGGIYSQNSSTVTINNSTITNNTSAFSGAGLYSNGSFVTATSSTFSTNKSSSNAGGLYNNNGTVSLNQVTFQANTAIKNGGAIYNYLGALNMTGGKVTGAHTAANGGGIYNNNANVIITSSTIEGATASGDGGGVYTTAGPSGGNIQFITSTVQSNKATGSGGGIFNVAWNGFSLQRSTVSNNTAGQKGGGIYSSGRLLAEQSTISTNTATGAAGGIYSYQDPDPNVENNNYVELYWTTIGYNKGPLSGGVYLENVNKTSTKSSIVAKNQLPDGTFVDYVGSPHSQDPEENPEFKSVFGEITGTTYYRSYDILHLSNIMPLASNGGPTKTHEIPTSSSAFNKFDGASGWICPATDQRGLPRPGPVGAGAKCDLGSYERQ